MSRRWRIVACCLSLGILCLSGCIVPYIYPSLSYVPSYELGEMQDCHVFRVDISTHEADLTDGEYTVEEIPRRSDGSFPPQFGLTVDRGFHFAFIPCFIQEVHYGNEVHISIVRPDRPGYQRIELYPWDVRPWEPSDWRGLPWNELSREFWDIAWVHSTRVRLYRPGFQLVELTPWVSTEKVQWQPAANWIEQVKAIDGLLLPQEVGDRKAAGSEKAPTQLRELPKPWVDFTGFAKAGTLLFVAAEYERVAALAPTPEDAALILKRAKELRTPRKPPTSEGSSLHDPH